jgi:hypothetical protein
MPTSSTGSKNMQALFALVSALLVLAVSAPAAAAGDAAKGKEAYGSGSPAMQKKYGDKWKAHASDAVQAMPDEELTKAFRDAAIHEGIAASVTDADLADLVAFIRTLKK